MDRADHSLAADVDLDHRAAELAACKRIATVGREVEVIHAWAGGHRERMLEAHRVRVAEVEPLQALGDDDRVATVRREVEVVWVLDRNRLARLAGTRVD